MVKHHGNKKHHCPHDVRRAVDCSICIIKSDRICKHRKRRDACNLCGGEALCKHNILKRKCKHCCHRKSLCDHGNIQWKCKKGCWKNCPHDLRKIRCQICNGSSSQYSAVPVPVYTAPDPVYTAPVPVYTAPDPVYTAPDPVYTAPVPVYTAPVPVYTAPVPVYPAPVPVYPAQVPVYPAQNKQMKRRMTSRFCEHGLRRDYCKDCGGGGICKHRIQKNYCKPCRGSRICEHGREKRFCRNCGGIGICEHNHEIRKCKRCRDEFCEKHATSSACYTKIHCPFCKEERIARSKQLKEWIDLGDGESGLNDCFSDLDDDDLVKGQPIPHEDTNCSFQNHTSFEELNVPSNSPDPESESYSWDEEPNLFEMNNYFGLDQ